MPIAKFKMQMLSMQGQYDAEPPHAAQDLAGWMSTAIARHFSCRKRATLSTQRVKCPATIATQTSPGRSVRVVSITMHHPSGTISCDTTEMYKGLRVSPVPCRPPV